MKKYIHISIFFIFIYSLSNAQTVTIDGQVWSTKNLDVSKFKNGDLIPQAKTDEEWKQAGESQKPAWCYYDNDPTNDKKFGKLYNWYAVNDKRGLAPEGFHIPTDEEWDDLFYFLGDNAGLKMKTKSGWKDKTGNGNNESGFTALPSGVRTYDARFCEIEKSAYYWSSTEKDSYSAMTVKLDYLSNNTSLYEWDKSEGYSVRCLKNK